MSKELSCVLAFASACAGTRPTPMPVDDQPSEVTLYDSTEYSAAPGIQGHTLVLELRAAEKCRSARTELGVREVTTMPCKARPVANEGIVVAADGIDWHASGRTDARGKVHFSLHDLPEAALLGSRSDPHDPSSQRDGRLRLTLGIDGIASIRVIVSKEMTRTLLAALIEDGGSRVALDRSAGQARTAQAKQALAACQAHVDRADFTSASDCWNTHADDWAVLRAAGGQVTARRMSFDVPTCLASATTALSAISACAAARETSDDEVIAKVACLPDYEQVELSTSCGPLDLKNGFADRIARLDVVKIQARIDAKAAPIVARREKARADEAERLAKAEAAEVDRLAKAEAAEKAAKARCVGSNVVQVIVNLQIGRDLDPRKMRDCKYKVAPGRVQTTTRDGWLIVVWGDNMAAAFKTAKRRADGSFLQTQGTATYLGLRAFDRTDGGNSTIATFKLSE